MENMSDKQLAALIKSFKKEDLIALLENNKDTDIDQAIKQIKAGDDKSLTSYRLSQVEARTKSIETKLDLALDGFVRKDFLDEVVLERNEKFSQINLRIDQIEVDVSDNSTRIKVFEDAKGRREAGFLGALKRNSENAGAMFVIGIIVVLILLAFYSTMNQNNTELQELIKATKTIQGIP